MAAKRGRKKKVENQLAEAMNFVSIAQKAGGIPYQEHTRIADGYAVATDGTLTAGHPVAADVQANAHTKTLRAALSRCGESFSVTKEADHLRIKSGRFSATVPCLRSVDMPPIPWEPSVASIDGRILEGFKICNPLIAENGAKLASQTLLLNPGSMAATNLSSVAEFWHGIDLPPGTVIPKLFVAAVVKLGLDPVGFGYDGRAVTFHYENGAFIRTQLFSDEWPDINRILCDTAQPWPIPEGFIEALETLKDFSEDGSVYSFEDSVQSHFSSTVGASIEIAGLPDGYRFSGRDMLLLLPYLETVDFKATSRVIMGFGENLRAGFARMAL